MISIFCICYSTFYDLLDITYYFEIKNYTTPHYTYYTYNIFDRACPTSDTYQTHLLYRLSNIKYKKPLPIIIESIYEENIFTNTNSANQLKSINLVFIHVFICYVMYNI